MQGPSGAGHCHVGVGDGLAGGGGDGAGVGDGWGDGWADGLGKPEGLAVGDALGEAVGDALGDAVGEAVHEPCVPLRKISDESAPQPCTSPDGCEYQARILVGSAFTKRAMMV